MAKSVPPFTWERGFREPTGTPQWIHEISTDDDNDAYFTPPSKEVITSSMHNDLGLNVLRTWPTIYDGTNDPHGIPDWWNPSNEVDVVICGAGPSGLEVALSLIRQGVTFRIIDKAETPLIAGRADGVQPRFLEILHTWGLAKEVHEEGPLIERTAIYKDGKKLLFANSHQSDSRYRGLHIITQGQVERIYIRDLLRHRTLVERSSIVSAFKVESSGTHPVSVTIRNQKTGKEEHIRSKFLVGSDGASSTVRKGLQIPFDGVSTDIYWGIMDCIFESDYPHAWVFGSVISSKHGGCVIIPREDGYIRLYTQLDVSATGHLATSRQQSDSSFAEVGGKVDVHSITPNEVLEQANRIFAPYKLKFAAPLSWFAIWKISERVARSFSSRDLRVHLVGDAAHVHSVMGAFGLNASIMDASNLAWKLGLVSQGKASLEALMPTYELERRDQACRIIETSGEYLRFICNATISIANVRDPDQLARSLPHGTSVVVNNDLPGPKAGDVRGYGEVKRASAIPINGVQKNGTTLNGMHANGTTTNGIATDDMAVNGNTTKARAVNGVTADSASAMEALETHDTDSQARDLQFLSSFFGRNGKFLLGVDAPFATSVISPKTTKEPNVVRVHSGVRAPNPRVCFSATETGYVYDKMTGAATFHVLVFVSNLRGSARRAVSSFASQALINPNSFYHRYGGASRFNIVVIAKCLPFEAVDRFDNEALQALAKVGTILYDDRAPDEDAHTTYGVSHSLGACVVVRPDLWVGTSVVPEDVEALDRYFSGFLCSS